MEKEFIPYVIVLALKELGFTNDVPSFGYYYKDSIKGYTFSRIGRWDNAISAPLYQQAFRWFRENYDITNSIIWKMPLDGNGYLTEIQNGREVFKLGLFVKYEEAELACLKKLIEIVKNK